VVGVPREVKPGEHRVALTPDGVQELVARNVPVLVEAGAGSGSSITDDDYIGRSAEIVHRTEDLWARSDIVMKVKEPQEAEFPLFRPGLVLFAYLHLAAHPAVADALVERHVTSVAYETVQLASGVLPLLAPMSEVAGRLAAQIGARFLERTSGGRGVLLGGVPGVEAGRVVIIGAGNAGGQAARVALGMGANVLVIDKDLDRLRLVDQIYQGSIATLASTKGAVQRSCEEADLVIGAVLVPGARAPVVVDDDAIRSMRVGSVIVDCAVDQGGCVEAIQETTHEDPVYERRGVLHYAVGNIPSSVPNTSTRALVNATLPYALELATLGVPAASQVDTALALGVNTAEGVVTHKAVARSLGRSSTPTTEVFA
jgi:alanine dehydrogenase